MPRDPRIDYEEFKKALIKEYPGNWNFHSLPGHRLWYEASLIIASFEFRIEWELQLGTPLVTWLIYHTDLVSEGMCESIEDAVKQMRDSAFELSNQLRKFADGDNNE